MAAVTRSPPRSAYAAVASVIWSASSAPIAIRYAQMEGVPSLYIIMVRLFLVSLCMTPFVLRYYRQELRELERKDWLWAMVAGLMHGLTIVLLFFSLEYASVLTSAVLRRTSPIWMIFLEILFLHAVFTRRVWFGLLLTVAGSILVGFGGATAIEGGSNPLLGGMLALLNALTNCFYLLIGRKLRHKLSFVSYSWLVFSSAGMIVFIFLLISQTPLYGYSRLGYFWILVVTVLAQLMGHLPLNAALQHFTATFLTVAMQLSVVLSAVLAFFFLSEIPSMLQIIGSLATIVGVTFVVSKSQSQ